MSNVPQFSGRAVLVTGGAGFIGSHLVDALLERGARVRVLDDLSNGKRENLAHCAGRIEFLEGDIRDSRDVPAGVRRESTSSSTRPPSARCRAR